MIFTSKEVSNAMFEAIISVAGNMQVTKVQKLIERASDPAAVKKIDPKAAIIGAALMYNTLIKNGVEIQWPVDEVTGFLEIMGVSK